MGNYVWQKIHYCFCRCHISQTHYEFLEGFSDQEDKGDVVDSAGAADLN